jgi:hypothetical protein
MRLFEAEVNNENRYHHWKKPAFGCAMGADNLQILAFYKLSC